MMNEVITTNGLTVNANLKGAFPGRAADSVRGNVLGD
jgi:hypothetical protein